MGLLDMFRRNKNEEVNEENVDLLIQEIENYKSKKGSELFNNIKKLFDENDIFDDKFENKVIYELYKNDINNNTYIEEGLKEYSKYYRLVNDIDLDILRDIIIKSILANVSVQNYISIFISSSDKLLAYNLLEEVVKYGKKNNMINELGDAVYDYFLRSRNYFGNEKTHYTRIKEYIIKYNSITSKNITDEFLDIDMRNAGIVDLSESRIDEIDYNLLNIDKKINDIKSDISNMDAKAQDNNKMVDEKYEAYKNGLEKEFRKINSHILHSKQELIKEREEGIALINKAIGSDVITREKVIKEAQRLKNVIKYFDKKIPFNERYKMALNNKDKNKIYDKNFDRILKYIILGHSVWLAGPTRSGKSYIAEEVANILGLRYYGIGRINDYITQIKGYYDVNSNFIKTLFQEYYENGGMIISDEIDLSDSQALNELSNILDNPGFKPYAFGNNEIVVPNNNFRFIATANTRGNNEEEGYVRNEQDKATMKRFKVVDIDYNEELERSMLKNDLELARFLHNIRKIENETILNDRSAKIIDITTATFKSLGDEISNGCLSESDMFDVDLCGGLNIDYLLNLSSKLNTLDPDNRYTKSFKKHIKGIK